MCILQIYLYMIETLYVNTKFWLYIVFFDALMFLINLLYYIILYDIKLLTPL